jgi:DnaJ-class molecular chaperone
MGRQFACYQAEGHNLRTVVPVDIENAVLGCETTVDTPNGPVKIDVPAWSGSDRVLVLNGHGLPKEDGTRGDLLIELRLMLWDHPDSKVTDLMRSLREGLYI